MAFFRRTFSRRLLPDRFQEITERVYVFDCCLSTKELSEQDYQLYMDTAVLNIQRHHPGASFMVFNLKEGDDPSLLSDILSRHDMTVVDYPRHYEGYPILPLEMINYFLRSSDSWLSLEGQRNVILMHCERRGWPALAFMLAGLLLYTKKQHGEMKTLDLVLKNSPKELWAPLSLMNPRPSQLRYLKYISGRSLTSDWPPADAALLIQSVILHDLPLFDGGKGCRPVVHVYCQDPSTKNSARPRLLCSSLMSEDGAHYFRKEDCVRVKINLNCSVKGDVFIECIHLGDDLVSEEKIFKVMFHTAFVQSYTMVLDSTQVDVLSSANCKIPNEFEVEVQFQNPEEVQLSVARGMASLESGHESESEFFEPEEFDVAVPRHHKSDNLLSKDILFSNLTAEDTTNVDQQKELDFSSFKSIGPENDFDNLEAQNQQIIEEEILSQGKGSEKVSEVDNLPIHIPSDERSSYQTSANVGSERVVEITGSKVQESNQSVFPVGGNEEQYDPIQPDVLENNQRIIEEEIVSSEKVSEIDNSPIHYPSVEDSSYQTSGANVGRERVITGIKVQDRDQSVFPVVGNQKEYDLIQFDVVEQSEKEGPDVAASSLIVYDSGKLVAEAEETIKDSSSSASLEAIKELISYQEDSSEAKRDGEVRDRDQSVFPVGGNGEEYDLIQFDVVEETIKDSSPSAALEAIKELISNQGDSSEAPDLLVVSKFGATEDSLQASLLEASLKPNIVVEGSESEPVIMQEAVNKGSEYGSELDSLLIPYEASKDIVEVEGTIKDGSPSAALEAIKELISNQEDNSAATDLSVVSEFRATEHPLQASQLVASLKPDVVVEGSELEPFIMQEVVNQGSEDWSEIAYSLIPSSKDIVEVEETTKEGSTLPSLEATMDVVSFEVPDLSLGAKFREITDHTLEARMEPVFLQEVVDQGSEDGSELASSLIAYKASKETVEAEETSKDGSASASLESSMELINNAMKSVILLEKNQEDILKGTDVSVDAEFREIEDYPLEARLEPKIVVEGSEGEPIVLQEVVYQGIEEDGSEIVIQEITQASPSEARLELNLAEKSFAAAQESQENSPNLEAAEGSEHGCSEISSSEIEYENCIMSKSVTSIEGSEDSSEAAYSHTGSEPFLAAQATSPEPTNAAKHIVVVVDSPEHDVKVQVEPRAASDVGSRGVPQKPKSKKKPMRLADAVAKVTMQKRVISMWVPRDKQLTSDEAKNRASAYKWVPKEPGSTSEEASKPAN